MTDFVNLPLQKLLNRGNIVTRVENLEHGQGARPSAIIGTLSNAGQSTGDMIVDGSIVVPNRTDGVPDVTIDDFGITFRNQEGIVTFKDTNGNVDVLSIFSDAGNFLVIENAVGGMGVSFLIDDVSHNVKQIDILDTGVDLNTAGLHYSIGGVNLAYQLNAEGTLTTPADATTYYFGSLPAAGMTTNTGRRRIYVKRAGTVKSITLFANFVAGTNEASSMWFRLNDTTDTLISNAVDMSSPPFTVTNSSVSIAVAAGDFFEIKWTTPTWATNPTSVNVSAQALIEF